MPKLNRRHFIWNYLNFSQCRELLECGWSGVYPVSVKWETITSKKNSKKKTRIKLNLSSICITHFWPIIPIYLTASQYAACDYFKNWNISRTLKYLPRRLLSRSMAWIGLIAEPVVRSIKCKSSPPEVFLGKGVLRICSKFTGVDLCQSVISIKLQSNFNWNSSSVWKFSCKFAAHFHNTFPLEHLWRAASEVCYQFSSLFYFHPTILKNNFKKKNLA